MKKGDKNLASSSFNPLKQLFIGKTCINSFMFVYLKQIFYFCVINYVFNNEKRLHIWIYTMKQGQWRLGAGSGC